METKIVLAKPIGLEKHSDSYENNKTSNILQRVLNLFKSVRPGSDLSRFQLPPLFNLPKSQLQFWGESVYSTTFDLLSSLNTGKTPLDRFISVVAWSISTTRPTIFGVVAYNPILGETHHVSKGNLNVLLEQVSHHPNVSALHATDQKENIEIIWCQYPVPKFIGTAVEGKLHGKRQLKLHNHGETYEMKSPNLLFRFLPVPKNEWVGNVRIQCLETGLVAELSYMCQSLFGFKGNRSMIKGKIFDSLSMKILYEIHGHWDSTVTVKDTTNEEVRVIYDAKEVISGLQAPIVKDPENVWTTESALVWSELSQAILRKDWEKAREAKKSVEERQRKLLRERESKGETWVPKHFIVSNGEEGWDCSPIENTVKVKDTNNGEGRVIYDAKQVISGLKAPIVKDEESVWATESALVWGELSQAIMNKEWEKAREAKQDVEERQRKMSKENWVPKNFRVSCSSREGKWDCSCSPIHKWVPAAPIIAQ